MTLTGQSREFPGFYTHLIQPGSQALQLKAKIGMACSSQRGKSHAQAAITGLQQGQVCLPDFL